MAKRVRKVKRVRRGKIKSFKKNKKIKKINTQKNSVDYSKRRTSEKIFVLAALLFMIFSIILLFNPDITTLVTLETPAIQTNYNAGDYLSGDLKLQLQQKDILPLDTRINLNILSGTEVPKCGTKICPETYLCPDGQTIPWMYCNTTVTPNKCRNVTYDSGYTGYPEKECCYINQENCVGLKEVLKNTDFSQQLTGNWNPTKSGSCVASLDNIIKLGTAGYSGKTDTTQATSTYYDYAKLTQSFNSIPISQLGIYTGGILEPEEPFANAMVVADFYDSFNFFVTYSIPVGTSTTLRKGYYFEIIVIGKDSLGITTKRLHYYFNLDKAAPANTANDKYITLANPLINRWSSYTRNLHSDWINKGFSETDFIVSIELHSAGKVTKTTTVPVITTVYGQQVNWDNVSLKYDSSSVTTCLGRGKTCCVEGTGLGTYYGSQLSCAIGECWDECTPSYSLSLQEFVASSTTPDSGNITTGPFKSGTTTLGGTGAGYGYCFETNDDENEACYGWDNKYVLTLGEEEFEIEVPQYNGTYELFLNVTYTNFLGMEWGLDSEKKTFSVGGAIVPSCPDSDYTFTAGTWSDWGDCISNNKTKKRTLYGIYEGSDNCPGTRNKTDTEIEGCTSCTPSWDCGWQPCSPGETQENYCADLNYCEPNYVKETRACCIEDWQCSSWSSCENGEQRRSCYDENNCGTEFGKEQEIRTCEKPFFTSLWWLWLLIVLVIVIIVVIFKGKSLFKPRRRARTMSMAGSGYRSGYGNNEYSELSNYIEQAFTYGATKEEIRRKLVDAGWPQDAIEKAFRATGR